MRGSIASPAGAGAATVHRNPSLVPESVQDESNRGWTDARHGALDVASTELRRRLLEDVLAHTLLLIPHRVTRGGDTQLEVVACDREDTGEVRDPRPNRVLAGMPTLLRVV